MTTSCIINTAALGPRAHDITGSRTPTPHAARAHVLRSVILPLAMSMFDDVIVAGEWEDGAGYRYVPCPSTTFSCVDALAQRQAGFEAATGDVLVFQHDDHLVLPFAPALLAALRGVLVPTRKTNLRSRNEVLPNGFPSYISGHCAIYARAVLDACPWGAVPPVHVWDIAHTAQIHAAGFPVNLSSQLIALDIEYGATPWQ